MSFDVPREDQRLAEDLAEARSGSPSAAAWSRIAQDQASQDFVVDVLDGVDPETVDAQVVIMSWWIWIMPSTTVGSFGEQVVEAEEVAYGLVAATKVSRRDLVHGSSSRRASSPPRHRERTSGCRGSSSPGPAVERVSPHSHVVEDVAVGVS